MSKRRSKRRSVNPALENNARNNQGTQWIDLSTTHPPVLVFMIYASVAQILIIMRKPYRSIIILLTNYRTRCGDSDLHRHDWQVNTIDGPAKLVRQDAILGGLSIGQLLVRGLFNTVE